MRIYAVDPGPQACGVVLYDTFHRTVIESHKAQPVADVLQAITAHGKASTAHVIACERVQSYGISGAHLLHTAEVYGRVLERANLARLEFVSMTRRDVLLWLDLLGAPGNRDANVRARMLELHGGGRRIACGTKAAPGPLYGVASHAWQALGLAVAVASSPR